MTSFIQEDSEYAREEITPIEAEEKPILSAVSPDAESIESP